MVYTAGGAGVILLTQQAQQLLIDRGVSGLMKECNFLFTDAICTSFNTVSMTVYQHLVYLDFVRDTSRPHSTFGCIPFTDTRYPHL